jgi:FkbM family methyltransferase
MKIFKNGHGIKFKSRPEFWAEVENGNWESDTFKVFDRYIKPDSTFIDIGAWNGVCSIYAKKLGAKVFTIEPDSNIHCELTENLKLNKCGLKFFYKVAISDKEGLVTLNTQSSFGNSESSLINRGNVNGETQIESTTLRSFVEYTDIDMSEVSLIKIDVEGGEVLILKQAQTFLAAHKPTIYVSFHPAWFPDKEQNIQDIIETIFAIYKVRRLVDGQMIDYTIESFRTAMETNHEHNFILEV